MKRVSIIAILMTFVAGPWLEIRAAEMGEPTGQKTLAATMSVFVFRTEGQNAEAQSKDEASCYSWAVQNAGTDPFQLVKQSDAQKAEAEQAKKQAE